MSEAQRPTTLCEAFQLTAALDPDAVALRTAGDVITLTMKLKRRPVVEKYAAEIEALYEAAPGPTVHEPKATVAAAN
ncbi:hypothetical protein [Mycolicibacterium sp. NCC-Tsukiji]|uniref:hypothetical protein n=1 Tax=Mycolicibacterium sp. NCC-Tsukiji TaxID=2185272 RepID=UPI000EBCD912|nr:hypothetical protein [Mycolicibacterium sp. NCC-Tsukiji]GCA96609.1 hypothetical protein NCCNTM_02440 [Mycolicibacterium sp. NCC-Tsukiji]